jgi:quinol monooxygenase YgiN
MFLSLLTNLHLVMSFSTSTPAGPFAINVKVALKPERRSEFLKVIKKDAAQTLSTEPGALQFVLGQDNDDANTFYFHEQYRTNADIDFHFSTPHFKEWKEFCDTEPFTAVPVVQIFHCNHEPVKIVARPAFCLNVGLFVKAEKREEFLAVISNNQKGSRQEPLCLQYDYGESKDTPNSFYFHEEYTGDDEGKEGLDAHAVTLHFAKWEEFAATNPFTKEPVISRFKSIV